MKEQTVEIPLSVYIDILDERRKYLEEKYDQQIPCDVFCYFLHKLKEGCIPDAEHSAPADVIDNIAFNGDYGPVEDYAVFSEIISQHKPEELQKLHPSELRRLFEACEGRKALFFYEDDNSEYGLGVCYSLRY